MVLGLPLDFTPNFVPSVPNVNPTNLPPRSHVFRTPMNLPIMNRGISYPMSMYGPQRNTMSGPGIVRNMPSINPNVRFPMYGPPRTIMSGHGIARNMRYPMNPNVQMPQRTTMGDTGMVRNMPSMNPNGHRAYGWVHPLMI